MQPSPLKHAPSRTKQLAALLLDLNKVRILHYAASGRVSNLSLHKQLRNHGGSVNPATLNRVLLRMARYGWLASNNLRAGRSPEYSLTAKGRAALNTARTHLKDLARLPHYQSRRQRSRDKPVTAT